MLLACQAVVDPEYAAHRDSTLCQEVGNLWSEAVDTGVGRLVGAAPQVTQILRRAASTARARSRRLAGLLSTEGIVAQTYVGTLGAGEEPLELLFVGREAFASEFEIYFRKDTAHKIQPSEVLFRGNVAGHALHRLALARRAAKVDIFASEVFPGSLALEGAFVHFPILSGWLPVEATVEQQIRRMRSRGQRSLARRVRRQDGFFAWIESDPEALETFYTTIHAPYIRSRFGAWGKLEELHALRKVYSRSGKILFVASRAAPTRPVCAALLYETRRGRSPTTSTASPRKLRPVRSRWRSPRWRSSWHC